MKTPTATFKLLLNWRLCLFLVAVVGIWLLPLRSESNLTDFSQNPLAPLLTWANFDGQQYLNLAETGYINGPIHFRAYFPLYPTVVRWLMALSLSPYLAGMIVSHTAFAIAIWLLLKLVRLDLNPKASRWTIYALLAFPTAFYFGTTYTESFFLLLSVAAIWYARQKNWLLASIFAALASATRISGILVGLVVLLEYLEAFKYQWRKLISPQGVWLLLIPTGLLGYMAYLQRHFGDALYFLQVQPLFGTPRIGEKIILLHQVFYRYTRMVIFIDHTSFTFLVAFLELFTALLFLWLIFQVWKLRRSYFIYALASFILPTLSGTFSSVPRYALVIFPAFMILGNWLSKTSPRRAWSYLIISSLLLGLLTVMFTRGYFVG
jgi:Gpi18-like mannosyltransferase